MHNILGGICLLIRNLFGTFAVDFLDLTNAQSVCDFEFGWGAVVRIDIFAKATHQLKLICVITSYVILILSIGTLRHLLICEWTLVRVIQVVTDQLFNLASRLLVVRFIVIDRQKTRAGA